MIPKKAVFSPLVLLLSLVFSFHAFSGGTSEAMIDQGRNRLAIGNYLEARTLFEQALSLEPDNREALVMLQRSLDLISEEEPRSILPETRSTSGSLTEAVPEKEVSDETVADIQKETENPSVEAVEIPSSSQARVSFFYRRGVESYRDKDYQSAVEAFDEVLKLDPDYRRAVHYRDWARDKVVKAELSGEREEEKGSGGNAESREAFEANDRGRNFMRSGRFMEAVAEFEKVLAADPGNEETASLLKEARLKLDEERFQASVAQANDLMEEEAAVRAAAQEREKRDLRMAYIAARQLMEGKDYESARDKFTEIRRRRESYRRTDEYLREIDKELWERRETRQVDIEDPIRFYTIGPQDGVRVVVRNHPEFSFEATIEEGGELIIPLTNEIIIAKDLTRDELAEEIRKYLTAYIENPFVNIFITAYRSKKYYVLQPRGGGGEFVMDKANMTLWDCMWRAGIPELGRTALRRVQVITPHPTHPTHRWINVYAMLYQGKMEDNIRIDPGTIIYYPMLAVDKFTELLRAVTRPIAALADTGDDWRSWDDFRKEYLR